MLLQDLSRKIDSVVWPLALKFTLIDDLYRRTIDDLIQKCLDENQARFAIGEVHEGYVELISRPTR